MSVWMQVVQHLGGDSFRLTQDAALPQLGPDDVLIKLSYAGVTSFDWGRSSGNEYVPGVSGVGDISDTGSRVTDFEQGDHVYFCVNGRDEERGGLAETNSRLSSSCGTYANYIAVPASLVALAPVGISDALISTLPVPGLLAWHCFSIFEGVSRDSSVLIHAGSLGGCFQDVDQWSRFDNKHIYGMRNHAGAAASLLVQLAREAGASVYVTAAPAAQLYMLGAGAEVVMDPIAHSFVTMTDAIRPDGVDFVFDFVGGRYYKDSFTVVREGGVILSLKEPPNLELSKKKSVRVGQMELRGDGRSLDRFTRALTQLGGSGTPAPTPGTPVPDDHHDSDGGSDADSHSPTTAASATSDLSRSRSETGGDLSLSTPGEGVGSGAAAAGCVLWEVWELPLSAAAEAYRLARSCSGVGPVFGVALRTSAPRLLQPSDAPTPSHSQAYPHPQAQAQAHKAGVLSKRSWVPDKMRTHCAICSRAFTLTRRRHHCRRCGDVMCEFCAPKLPISSSSSSSRRGGGGAASAVRTCSSCRQALLEQSRQQQQQQQQRRVLRRAGSTPLPLIIPHVEAATAAPAHVPAPTAAPVHVPAPAAAAAAGSGSGGPTPSPQAVSSGGEPSSLWRPSNIIRRRVFLNRRSRSSSNISISSSSITKGGEGFGGGGG